MRPDAEAVRQQRFDLIYHAQLSWADWAAMTPADRDDFVHRFNAAKVKEGEQQKGIWGALQGMLKPLMGKGR